MDMAEVVATRVCGIRGSRLCGEVCCCELRHRGCVTESIVQFCGVYGVRRGEVRGEGTGSLEWEFLGQSDGNADIKSCEELCGVEPFYLIRCQWYKILLQP